MGKTPTTSTKDIPNGANSPQRKKIVIGQKLPFSPRTKVPTVNKVFVLGTQLGIILLRTQRQSNSNENYWCSIKIEHYQDMLPSSIKIN